MSCLNLLIVLYCILSCYLFVFIFFGIIFFWCWAQGPSIQVHWTLVYWVHTFLGAHRQATSSGPRSENRGGPKVFLLVSHAKILHGSIWACHQLNQMCISSAGFIFHAFLRHAPSCFVPSHMETLGGPIDLTALLHFQHPTWPAPTLLMHSLGSLHESLCMQG